MLVRYIRQHNVKHKNNLIVRNVIFFIFDLTHPNFRGDLNFGHHYGIQKHILKQNSTISLWVFLCVFVHCVYIEKQNQKNGFWKYSEVIKIFGNWLMFSHMQNPGFFSVSKKKACIQYANHHSICLLKCIKHT